MLDLRNKYLVLLDCQTTGIDFNKDEIIFISLNVIKNDEVIFEMNEYIDPENDELQFHNGLEHNQIDWANVKKGPPFIELAPKLLQILNKADYIIGYNIDFELKFLQKAFIKHGGVKIKNFKFLRIPTLDPFKFWMKKDCKNIENAFKIFANKEIDKLDFQGINEGQYDLLTGIINHYGSTLDEILQVTNEKPLGWNGLVKLNNNTGELLFNFGKYKNQLVDDIVQKDKGYLEWIVNKSDFDPITKTIIKTKLK